MRVVHCLDNVIFSRAYKQETRSFLSCFITSSNKLSREYSKPFFHEKVQITSTLYPESDFETISLPEHVRPYHRTILLLSMDEYMRYLDTQIAEGPIEESTPFQALLE